MQSCSGSQGQCQTINAVLSRVGDRWSVLVIFTLRDGRRRFNELKRELDISQRMLSLTLRDLERDGLVSRHYHQTIPPKVEYELTDLGQSLRRPVEVLARWAVDNHAAIDAARDAFHSAQDQAGAA
ncbi:winged helix-turn-helix transcriptional regulator [Paragemmobacter aquarius]|nr:helix-turn-helix domain-containing protein [Gemmobacter aquarius]